MLWASFGLLLLVMANVVVLLPMTEDEPLFTDYHHPWLFFLATGIMLLSCFDAFFTLQLLDRGAVEINPVMMVLLKRLMKVELTYSNTYKSFKYDA